MKKAIFNSLWYHCKSRILANMTSWYMKIQDLHISEEISTDSIMFPLYQDLLPPAHVHKEQGFLTGLRTVPGTQKVVSRS